MIRLGGNALGTIVAALIIAGAAIYSINQCVVNHQKEKCPKQNLEQGIERLKEAAGQAMESRQ